MATELPIPQLHDPDAVGKIWQVPYDGVFQAAMDWKKKYKISNAIKDRYLVNLTIIDAQITFCIPGGVHSFWSGELFVGGRTGDGAVEDNKRLCNFIYKNTPVITEIDPTMDTHVPGQIFFREFWINDAGEFPTPFTLITYDDIVNGVWKVNPAMIYMFPLPENKGGGYLPLTELQKQAEFYAQQLRDQDRGIKGLPNYAPTIWPPHAMLTGIGHALVPAIDQAVRFHRDCRWGKNDIQIKGSNLLTENYSVVNPEVKQWWHGGALVQPNLKFIEKLLKFDVVIIAGQAKSHCVAWSIADILSDILKKDKALAEKIYLLEDCTSPVVIPGIHDYTDEADAAFEEFRKAGMKIVKSTDPIDTWPGMRLAA
jgi:nicotinamidase-related amidase